MQGVWLCSLVREVPKYLLVQLKTFFLKKVFLQLLHQDFPCGSAGKESACNV